MRSTSAGRLRCGAERSGESGSQAGRAQLARLPAGKHDAADLVIYWANWCGGPTGPLSVQVMLPAGGKVSGPFNGPPDYNLVPGCLQHGRPSTVSVVDAYGPGLAG